MIFHHSVGFSNILSVTGSLIFWQNIFRIDTNIWVCWLYHESEHWCPTRLCNRTCTVLLVYILYWCIVEHNSVEKNVIVFGQIFLINQLNQFTKLFWPKQLMSQNTHWIIKLKTIIFAHVVTLNNKTLISLIENSNMCLCVHMHILCSFNATLSGFICIQWN